MDEQQVCASLSSLRSGEHLSPWRVGAELRRSDATGSTASTKKTKTWLGKEVKRPRAEYQAEIDALKLKIASLETDLERCTVELQQFKDWVGMAPWTF